MGVCLILGTCNKVASDSPWDLYYVISTCAYWIVAISSPICMLDLDITVISNSDRWADDKASSSLYVRGLFYSSFHESEPDEKGRKSTPWKLASLPSFRYLSIPVLLWVNFIPSSLMGNSASDQLSLFLLPLIQTGHQVSWAFVSCWMVVT